VPLTVAFSADGKTVVADSGDKVLTFIDAATGKTIRRMDRTSQPVALAEVSPAGKSVATMFMKAESMLEPDRVIVRAFDSGAVEVDWLPPALPLGAGWTSAGQLLVAVPAADGMRVWRLR
jgi:hypothetical protein